MPLIRYFLLIGSALLGSLLWLSSEPDQPAASPAAARWTSVDALRAMAHIGEPVPGRDRNIRFSRSAVVSIAQAKAAEPATRPDAAPVEASPKPSLLNAHASLDSMSVRAPKAKRRQARTPAPRRVRTAVAANPPRTSPDVFQPPSW